MDNEKLVEIVTFRLTKAEFKPYKTMLSQTHISKSKLFRQVFVAKSGDLVLTKEQSQDNSRLVFLASKASNNINQIARKLNRAYRGGIISETTYLTTLNSLISIEQSFCAAIKKC